MAEEKMNPEIKKFTDDELKKLKDLQTNYIQIKEQFGDLYIRKKLLDEVESKLNGIYDNLHKKEEIFMEELQSKYGVGNLDMKTGEFTPAPK